MLICATEFCLRSRASQPNMLRIANSAPPHYMAPSAHQNPDYIRPDRAICSDDSLYTFGPCVWSALYSDRPDVTYSDAVSKLG